MTTNLRGEASLEDSAVLSTDIDRLSTVWNYGRDILTVLDKNGTWRWTSPAGLRQLGYGEDFRAEHGIGSLIHPDDVRSMYEAIDAMVAGTRNVDTPVLYRVKASDGTWRWFETVIEPRLDDPDIDGILLFSRDAVKGEQATEALDEARDILEKAFVESPVGMILTDKDFIITQTNAAINRMLGYEAGEGIGQCTLDWGHPDEGDVVVKILGQLLSGDIVEPASYRIRHKDGSWVPVQLAVARLTGAGGGFVLHTVDLTALDAAQKDLEASEARYRLLVESALDIVMLHDVDNVCLYASPSIETLLGYKPEEFVGQRSFGPAGATYIGDAVARYQEAIAAGSSSVEVEVEVTAHDGTIRRLQLGSRLVRDDSGKLKEIRTSGHDVTDLHNATQALGSRERRFRRLLLGAFEYTVIIGKDGKLTYVSPNTGQVAVGETVVGEASSAEAMGELIHPDDRAALGATMADVFAGELGMSRELRYRTRDDVTDKGWRWVEGMMTNFIEDPDIEGLVLNVRDITDRVTADQLLAHQAVHDGLTGLLNRGEITQQLEHYVESDAAGLAVLFCDLDRFKGVNDTYGHGVGDKLLQTVAQRLAGAVRPGDMVSRFGGDEFVVVCTGVAAAAAACVGQRMCDTLVAPVRIAGGTFPVSASVGIALWDGTESVSELLREADTAMYAAKAKGRGQVVIFDASMHRAAADKAVIETRLHAGIRDGSIRAFYQSQVSLTTGEIIGFEALARWHDSERGLVPPDSFLPVAESAGLMVSLDSTIRTQAFDQLSVWRAAGHTKLGMSVNCSRRTLQTEGLGTQITQELEARSIPGVCVTIEVTEDVLVGDDSTIAVNLSVLHEYGVVLAVDDFGTGYSGLSQLKSFPASLLKVDKSFVFGLAHDRHDAAIVAAIIAMANTMELKVCAEGIETEEQRNLLAQAGCHYGQGYLYSKPVCADDASRLLAGAEIAAPA